MSHVYPVLILLSSLWPILIILVHLHVVISFVLSDNNNNNNIITMAEQPYMGSGLLLPPVSKVTKSCAFVAVGDWPTGRAGVLSILMCPPEPSGRQSGDLGEKWRL
jgi:hypothetical protein